MPNLLACPDITHLSQVLSGKLPDADMETLLQHIETCDACANKIGTMPNNDSLVELMRQSKSLGELPFKDKVGPLILNLRKIFPAKTPTVGEEKTLLPAGADAFLTFTCPQCSKSLKVKAHLAGKKVKCPLCQAVVEVSMRDVAAERTIPPAASAVSVQTQASSPSNGDTIPPEPKAVERELVDFLSPPQAPDELGRLGNYRVLKILGAGGMGVVYQAEDPQLKRLVALKVMLPGLGASANARKRFLREAQAAAAIKHDHIVTIHQVGEDRGVPYLAMEFLKGEPLDERLKRETILPLAETLRIGREMAEGMAAAHEEGLIHRDIKPANVWLETRGAIKPQGEVLRTLRVPPRVKILDFGLARAASEEAHLTQSGAIVGTPAYMAPEQAKSKNVDHRCDLFSLGVVLYRLCTGVMPFKGDDTISTLMAVATENPPPPSTVSRDVSKALSDLVMQLLAKDPAERPASARAVADRLESLERPPASTPTGRAGSASDRSSSPRPRRLLPLAVAAVLLILLPLGWFFGGTIVRIATNKGELVIDSSDPNIEVTIKGESATLYDKVKERRFVLTAGKYDVEVREEGDGGLRFTTKKFTITRGGRETFHAHLELAQAKLSDDVKDPVKPPEIKKDDVKKEPVTLPEIKKEDVKKDPVKPPEVKKNAKDSREKWLQIADAVLALGGKIRLISHTSAPGRVDMGVSEFPTTPVPPGEWVRQRQGSHHFEMNGISLAGRKQHVTDEVLTHLDLGSFGLLETLDLDVTNTGNPGLEQLKAPNLRRLYLSHTLVSDAGLVWLNANLEGLHLDATLVSDAGLERLGAFTRLRDLSLRGTKVSDAGLKHLKTLPIVRLDLSDTSVSDDGLAHLKWLKKLEYLNLRGTKVTAAGIDAMRQARPKAFIDANFGTGGDVQEWIARLGARISGGDVDLSVVPAYAPWAHKSWTIPFCPESFANKWITNAGLDNLKTMKTPLVSLNLRGTLVSDAGFAHRKDFPSLTTLRLGETMIGDAGLEHLKMVPKLEILDLSTTSVTDTGLIHLKTLTNLRGLDLNGTKVTPAGLKELAPLTKLATLNLDGVPATNEALRALRENGMLLPWVNGRGKANELVLEGTQVTDAGLKELMILENLAILDLSNTPVTDAGMIHLKTLTNLRRLKLSGTKVTAAGLKELAPLTNLAITLDSPVTDATLRALHENGVLPHWTSGRGNSNELVLAGTQVTDAGLKELMGLKTLSSLDLSKLPVTDAGLVHLKTLINLRGLNLNGTKVTIAGLSELAPLKHLQTLNLDGLPVTDEALHALRENGMLPSWVNGRGGNQLYLAGTKVTDTGLKELTILQNLDTLDLSDTAVTDGGLIDLKTLAKLKQLALSGTKVSGPGLAHLKSLSGLQRLDLNGTSVSDAGLAHLKTLITLRELRLEGTKVTGPGLANLEPLTELQLLDLSNTPVTDAGLAPVQSLITLPVLRLNGTKVSDAGLAHLKELTNLRELSLGNTRVTAAGVADLRKALPKCKIDGPMAK